MHTVVLAVPVGVAQEGADDCGEEALAVVNVRPKWLVQVRLDKHRGFREETTKPCPMRCPMCQERHVRDLTGI